MMQDKMLRTMFHIPQSQRKALRAISDKTGIPAAQIVRWAIDDWLKTKANKVRRNG